jgi:hypothetical protein
MLCLEVVVNGVSRYVAGIAGAEMITAQFAVYPSLGQSRITTTAEIIPEGQPPAEASWPSVSIQLGEEVLVRLVESGEPTAPHVGRTDTDVQASDDIPFVCSFCGKAPSAVKQMLSSRHALICNECVAAFHEDLIRGS